MAKAIARMIFCALGVFACCWFLICACEPQANPWYVQAVLAAISALVAFRLEDKRIKEGEAKHLE